MKISGYRKYSRDKKSGKVKRNKIPARLRNSAASVKIPASKEAVWIDNPDYDGTKKRGKKRVRVTRNVKKRAVTARTMSKWKHKKKSRR